MRIRPAYTTVALKKIQELSNISNLYKVELYIVCNIRLYKDYNHLVSRQFAYYASRFGNFESHFVNELLSGSRLKYSGFWHRVVL